MSSSSTAPDWPAIRAQFAATEGQAYLNSATYGPPPRPVAEAVLAAHAEWTRGHGDWSAWEGAGERARAAFARLIGAPRETVALLPAVSVAAGQVAERLPFRPGANVVLGGGEFRSNLFAWMVQERRGFELRVVPFRDGRLTLDDLAGAVDARTAPVSYTHLTLPTIYSV